MRIQVGAEFPIAPALACHYDESNPRIPYDAGNGQPVSTGMNGILFLAPTAVVCGDVACGAGVNVWFGAVVRGDVAPITLGDNVNLQDGAVVHCDSGVPNIVEPGVVVGHAAVLHGARVGADTLVGIGARLLSGSDVGAECIIAAGAVLAPGSRVPPRSVVMGIPGKVVRNATAEEIALTRAINARYRELARRYANGEVPFPFGKPTLDPRRHLTD
jgi:carbonic anhydrase/acetyltransferase-like protein (isoleucine patch superfamily)